MKSLNDLVWHGSVDQYFEFKITPSAFAANGDSCLFSIENPHTMLKLPSPLVVDLATDTLCLTLSKKLSTSFSEF